MVISFIFLFISPLYLFGYQSMLEEKGINEPTLAISLFKTTVLLDIATKLLFFPFIDNLDAFAITCLIVTIFFPIGFLTSLSLNIPKTSLRKFKKYPQNTNYTLCAFKVIRWYSLSILFNTSLLLLGWKFEEPIFIFIICAFMVAIMILYIIFATKSLIRLDKLKHPSLRSLNALSHNNSPIVLLRSFKLDSNLTINGKVFDETICENIDLDNNPIISLANPDEILPSGGSLKIQAKDADWKEVVKSLLINSRAVILVEGQSDGLHWEISKLKELLNHKQLFVMIPSNKYRELAWCYTEDAGSGLYSILRNAHNFIAKITIPGRRERKKILYDVWKDFSSKLRQFGIETPNNFPGENSLIYFDENWKGKKLESLYEMKQMMDCIVDMTKSFNNKNFDYSKLGEKIASYEVNGFLNKEEIIPFKNIVDKYNRIGKIIALTELTLFAILLVL